MLVVTKSRDADDIPTTLFKKTAKTVSKSTKRRLHKVAGSWKHGLVSPIFKDGNTGEVKDYRPVILLNIISKKVEKLGLTIISEHLLNNITSGQFGFVTRRSVIWHYITSLSNISEILVNQKSSVSYCSLIS